MKPCPNCRYLLYDDVAFCVRCGAPQAAQPRRQPRSQPRPARRHWRPSRPVAVVLAFLLGSFGLHHFYLRHYVRGALSLLFCWTSIPAALSVLEGIVMLCQTESQFLSIHNAKNMLY